MKKIPVYIRLNVLGAALCLAAGWLLFGLWAAKMIGAVFLARMGIDALILANERSKRGNANHDHRQATEGTSGEGAG